MSTNAALLLSCTRAPQSSVPITQIWHGTKPCEPSPGLSLNKTPTSVGALNQDEDGPVVSRAPLAVRPR
jgi:hypothetical protein